ncbi:MAG: ATP-binding cassette domain-containing protein [Planctomycetota bacterium]
MINVDHMTKRYAGVTAVKDISFSVKAGEVVGFLGPNGAGKTTTMRVLTCYFPPSEGRVSVAGYDVIRESEDVRGSIGYLPENVPLYTDMRVTEYLSFRAALKGVPRGKRKERLEYVLEKCSLLDVRDRIIGQLSKGYKQRTGLADALIHNPKLLVLDEPTIGLDPNQIIQARSLIKDLGREHTVLLSSHILSEVEQICTRVIIINKGKIVAQGTKEELVRGLGGAAKFVAEVAAEPALVEKALKNVGGLKDLVVASANGAARASFTSADGGDLRETAARALHSHGLVARELKGVGATLEDVFVSVTGEKNALAK